MSIAITLGFDSSKRTASPLLLYCGESKQDATDLFMTPPPGVKRTELILNPPPTRRRNHDGEGSGFEPGEVVVVDDDSAAEILRLAGELEKVNVENERITTAFEKSRETLTADHDALKKLFNETEGGKNLAEQEMERLKKVVAAKDEEIVALKGSLKNLEEKYQLALADVVAGTGGADKERQPDADAPTLLPESAGTAREAKLKGK